MVLGYFVVNQQLKETLKSVSTYVIFIYVFIYLFSYTHIEVCIAREQISMWPSAVAVGVASILWFGSDLNHYLTLALCLALYIILGGSLTLWQIYKTFLRDARWVQIKRSLLLWNLFSTSYVKFSQQKVRLILKS